MTRLSDEWAIYTLVARLARAADDRDAAAYRDTLADAVWVDAPEETAPIAAEDYVHAAMQRLSETLWTHHRISNPTIDIASDRLRASATFDAVVTACRERSASIAQLTTYGGRYQLGFVRGAAGWRIERRNFAKRYSYGQSVVVTS